jgi:hypothetical protein
MQRRAATLIAAALVLSVSLVSLAQAAHPIREWVFDKVAKGSEKVNNPYGKVVLDGSGHAVVAGAQTIFGTAAYSGGWWIAAGWKATDLTAKLGDAALHAEDVSRGSQLILANKDAALLKDLLAAGLDLNTDPRAVAVKERLRAASKDLNSSDLNSGEYLLTVTRRHLKYAVTEVAMNEAASFALGKLTDRLRPWIGKLFPSSERVAGWVDRRGRFRTQLKLMRWSHFEERERAARKFTELYAKRLSDLAADQIVDSMLKESGENLLDRLCERMGCNAARPIAGPIAGPTIRLEMARFAVPQLAMPAPVTAMIPAPAQITAMIPAPQAVMRAAPARIEYMRAAYPPIDPVEAVIDYEDRITRRAPAADPPPPAREPVAEPPPPTERELRLHHEWECAGAGNKAGCGDVNWDGRRQP